MNMRLALTIGHGRSGNGAATLTMSGLTSGEARPGSHASLSVAFPPNVTAWTSQAWGVGTHGDTTYGTGASPTDYTASDGLILVWEGLGDDGNTYRSSAAIRYAPGSVTESVLADWTIDDDTLNINFVTDFTTTNLTGSYVVTGLPSGAIDDGDGSISGTPDGTPQSTNITVTFTDQYGRNVVGTYPITTAYRTQATAADGIGPLAYVIDDSDTISINFVADFTTNGNTLSYAITGLPTGGVDDTDGTASGTATTVGESGSIVCTGTDEYGRQTTSTASFTTAYRAQATAANGLGPYAWTVDDDTLDINAASDFTANGNSLSYVITGLPTGLTDDTDGTFSGTPTVDGESGTITVTATDEYGRVTTSTPTFSTAYRAQATGGADLDLAFAEDSAITATDLTQNWTLNGNTVTWAVVETLPTGLSVSTAGSMTGTPTDQTADATYTLRGTDEYSRVTDDFFTLEITAVDSTAPTASSVTAGSQQADGDLPITVDSLDEDSTALWVLTSSDQSAAANTAVETAAEGGTALTDQVDYGSFSATIGGGPYNETITSSLDGNYYLQVVFRDTVGNLSTVYPDGPIAIDTTAPTTATLSPADNATDVAVDSNIVMTFAEGMKRQGTVTLKNVGGTTIQTFNLASQGTWSTTTETDDTWTGDPTSDFINEASLAVQWSGLEDTTGNALADNATDTTWNFDVVAAASDPRLSDTDALYWYAPDSVQHTSGVITSWDDKTSNNHDLAQIGSLGLPNYDTGGDYVYFDGSEIIGDTSIAHADLGKAELDGGGELSIWMVVQPDSTSTQAYYEMFQEGTGGTARGSNFQLRVAGIYLTSTGYGYETSNRNTGFAYTPLTTNSGMNNTLALVEVIATQSDVDIDINDGDYTVNATPTTGNFAASGDGLAIGALTNGTSLASGFEGRIYEVYATTTTDGTLRSNIRSHLLSEYGIS